PADLSLRVRRGKITVLAGPSGTGKTTAMNVSLGLIPADAGQVVLHTASGPVDLADVDLPTWWAQVSWVPQRPTFEPATLAETLGGTHEARQRALRAAGLLDVVEEIGWDTRIGHGAYGLSVGQGQRLALA